MKKLASLLLAAGFIIILTTAMASDSSQSLQLGKIIARGFSGLALMGAGAFIIDVNERRKTK